MSLDIVLVAGQQISIASAKIVFIAVWAATHNFPSIFLDTS
jgi:hypothetical protein